MKNVALIRKIQKELEIHKDTYLEDGLIHVLNLLEKEEDFQYKPDETEAFIDKLGTNVLVEDDYYCDKNILYLGVTSYKDKKQGRYQFQSDRKNPLHTESCVSSKHRTSVIFNKEDCKNLFYKNLNNWINRNSNLDFCFDFSNVKDCFGKVCLFLTIEKQKGYFLLEKGFIKEGSLVYPVEICDNMMTHRFPDGKIPTGWFPQSSWSNRICKVFAFCEEDYAEIISILENFYDFIN